MKPLFNRDTHVSPAHTGKQGKVEKKHGDGLATYWGVATAGYKGPVFEGMKRLSDLKSEKGNW